MKKARFVFRLFFAFVKQHFNLIALGFLVGLATFFSLSTFRKHLPQKKLVKIGIVGQFTAEEPPPEISQLLSRGLTRLLPDGTATGSLALDWEVLDQGKTYKFFLRDDAFWHDGKRVTAKDIAYDFKNALVEPAGDFQVKVSLKEPFSPLPVVLSRPVFRKGNLGNGTYRTKKIERTGRFLRRLDLAPAKEGLASLSFRFYPTEESAKIGFKLGEVDILQSMSDPGELANYRGVRIRSEIRQNQYSAIFFNTKKAGLEVKSFRQALAYALKKEKGAIRAITPISGLSWAFNANVKPYEQDLGWAKKMIEKERPTDNIELSVFPSLIPLSNEVVKDWEALGVRTDIKVTNSVPEDFQALLATWEIPPDPDQYSFWHSTQTGNLTGLVNPRIDKLLEEGRKIAERADRRSLYLDFQKFLVEECPAVFLRHPLLYTISREGLPEELDKNLEL